MGIDEGRLHLVWNGVPAAPSSDREVVRRTWGCGPEHTVLGCVARLEPQKNPLFLLSLLARLPQTVRVVWIGDGSLRKPLLEAATALGVADRVILPGWQRNARSFLSGFDVFVLPSVYEGFPLAILEAMAAGLPCVVSDVDGIAEAVVDGQTGFVCPPNATEIWLDRITKYLGDTAARERSGTLASTNYRKHFSLEAMVRKTTDVYYELMAS